MARKRAPNGSGLQPRLRPDGRWEARFMYGIDPRDRQKEIQMHLRTYLHRMRKKAARSRRTRRRGQLFRAETNARL